MAFLNRSFVEIETFSREEIEYVLTQALHFKKALTNKDVSAYRLAEKDDRFCAVLFYENSTRTSTSFSIAATRLGLKLTGFSGTEGTSVKKGESLRHTLDMYEAYQCDAVVLRHPLDGAAKFASQHLSIPVFNGGDGKNQHPTQTILDLFTIFEHAGKIDGLDIGLCGDLKYGRTAHSLVVALTKFKDVKVHLFSHPDLALPPALIKLLEENSVKVFVHSSLAEMVPTLDFLYSTRIQKERMPDLSEYERAKSVCTFTLSMLETAKKTFGIMHPLPMDKAAPSIDPEVDDKPQALYKVQAGNGVPTRFTELALSLGYVGRDFGTPQKETEDLDNTDFIEEREVVDKPLRTDVSIRPIRQNGVVIDHIAPYQEDIMIGVLRVRERRDIYRAGTVRSLSRGVCKGMLMIEDREFTTEELRNIAVVSPNCRVNTIRAGKVVRKIDLRLPSVIQSFVGVKPHLMQCLNTGCITRPEHLENVPPKFTRIGPDCVKCFYCNNISEPSAIFIAK